ncbi:MAG TPA: ATP-binding protein [Stenotrophomonas sp.]|jgi:PAS domain S-box-containing protein
MAVPHPGASASRPPARTGAPWVRLAASLLTLAIFLVDTLSTLEGAVAVLYVVAVLLVARTGQRRDILIAALAGLVLTLAAYIDSHGLRHVGAQTVRAGVSLAAIGISALLALQNQRALAALAAQATLLDLSHDMIFVRTATGMIRFWNRTAEERYGWSRQEAIGQVADLLLRTQYPQPRHEIEAALLADGRWDGTLRQRTRHGQVRRLDSRWVLQRDARGRPLDVLETHTDVTDRHAAHAALIRSERRYRRMFDATRIGVVEQDWRALRTGLAALGVHDAQALAARLPNEPSLLGYARKQVRLADANPAFLAMVGHEGTGQAPRSLDEVLAEDDDTFAGSLQAYLRGEAFFAGETDLLRADGRRVPMLFTITFPAAHDGDDDGHVLVFVVDIRERRQAQDALLHAQAELAHAARVATLGELTASIAHEVNQPLSAAVTYGEAGLRWLRRQPPDLEEVDTAITRIVAEGRRASEIVKHVRDFVRKAPSNRELLQVGTLIEEAARLVQHELDRAGVTLRLEVAAPLPPVQGDRIQLEQLLVNLMLNASQAMAAQPLPRQLRMSASARDEGRLLVVVSDNGPGIAAEHRDQLFQPFFTTKAQGMGMGLAICRTTAEAHGGQLTVDSSPGEGSRFTLVLAPASVGETA